MRALDLRRQFSLLENGRFRLLFFATFASGIGNWLAVIALQVDVYDRTHSGWWVGALLIANILPAVFLGLLLGPLVDRLSRKGLMIGSDVGGSRVFVALPFAELRDRDRRSSRRSPGIGNAFFRPAVLAGLPNLVAEERARRPRTRCSSSSSGRRPRSGRSSAARSSPRPGPDLAYWVNAATFAVSALLVLADPGAAAAERAPDRPRPLGRPRRGVRASCATRGRCCACSSSGRS